MTTCELRLKAVDVIEGRGWAHGSRELNDQSGRICAWLALVSAVGPDYTLARRAASRMGFKPGRGNRVAPMVIRWNDAPERTKEEVLARLRDGCTPAPVSHG